MKRKILKIAGAIIAVIGILLVLGTAGENDLAAELGTSGLTQSETMLREIIGILLFAAGSTGALTLQK